MFTKKKINNKSKITCPVDKKSVQFHSYNQKDFPKNMIVLSLLPNLKEIKDNKLGDSLGLDKYLPP